ncbi:MAG: biotin--[acetyl-CoA-carboxylase] ligase, partial [Pseudomonadota bacterium]
MISSFLSNNASDYRHLAFDDSKSTNELCFEEARRGDPGNLWITAKRQTEGKGSRGRSWVSKPGNLYASLLLLDPCLLNKLPELTFVASLTAREAIAAQLMENSDTSVEVKWPNDVLINGKKSAGILLESTKTTGALQVVIGMGINIQHHPQQTQHLATNLLQEGVDIKPQEFFETLADKMAENLTKWDRGDNFSA